MKRFISILLILATVMSCFMLTVSANDFIVSDEGDLPFEDVKNNHWFYQAVRFCYANEIIKGMNDYTFGFSGQLTRAQFVTMLANLEGVDTSTYTVTQFPDVKSSHWYYGAVAWAYSEGIVSGMNDGSFAPNKSLSRAELAVIMKNYMDGKYEVEVSDSVLDKFTDKPKSEYWYYEAMKFAVSAELLSGNSDGTLASTGTVTRAQAAVIFKSFMNNYFYGDCEHEFTEATCTEPAVCGKCGLADDLPIGHFLTAYDCVTGGKCFICEEEVAPSKTLHDFAPATCTAPITCTRCHATRGEALGHKWKAATCTEPKVCVVCNTKEGSALGHTTTTGTCGRCGKVFSVSDYDKIVNLLKTKGEFDPSTNCYTLYTEDNDSITGIVYSVSGADLSVVNYRLYSNGHEDLTNLYITETGTVYSYLYMYANTTEFLFAGYGLLDAATFTKSTKEGFSDYEGTLKSAYTDYMNSALKEMLNDLNKILNPYGYSVKQLGFKVY